MDAIHVNSTLPFFAKHPDSAYFIEKFSLYTAVLSALEWRRHNGRIFMCTDSAGAAYYKRLGIETVWDGIRKTVPDDLEGIHPETFWAAGKLFALREARGACALVDEDFIVWKKLSLSETAVTCAHREDLFPDIYPDPDCFGADFPLLDRLDKTVLPCNTAFLYIPDESFRRLYAGQSIAFMKSAPENPDPLCPMVFAEQRLLAMLCALTGTKIETLLDKDRLFVSQESFTHLWGAKQVMRDSEARREDFLERCRRRITADFPEYAFVIARIEAE